MAPEDPPQHSRPRVLHCIPTLEQGGAERLLVELARQDKAAEHVVVKIFAGRHFFDDPAGIETHDLGLPRSTMAVLLLPLAALRFMRLVRAERPSIVVGWLYYGVLAANLARFVGVPVIWSIHVAANDESSFKRVTWTARWVCGRLSHSVPALIHYCAEESRIAHEADGFAPGKSRVVENGVDVALFESKSNNRGNPCGALPGSAVAAFPELEDAIANQVPLIGCIARFDPMKDHETLFTAAAILKDRGRDFRIVLAGRGCDRSNAKLVASLESHGVEREFILLGVVTNVADLYRSLTVVASSSSSEAMSMSILEALASGKAVVVTDVGSNRNLVAGLGLVAPPRNPGVLADLVEQAVWLDPSLARRAQADAPAYVAANFSMQKCIASWGQLFAEALRRP